MELAACWTHLLNHNRNCTLISPIQTHSHHSNSEKKQKQSFYIGIIFTIVSLSAVHLACHGQDFGDPNYKIASSMNHSDIQQLYMDPPESSGRIAVAQERSSLLKSNSMNRNAISVWITKRNWNKKKPYVISLPADPKGYSLFRNRRFWIQGCHVAPNEEITAYFDQ